MEKPKSSAEKATRTVVDCISFTPEEAKAWRKPPFQRDIKLTPKVRELIEEVKKNEGVLSGVITLGRLKGEPGVYLVDGQHRREAFLLSGVAIGYADVVTQFFNTMAEMAEAFVRLNSQLRPFKPDDVLRGLEESVPLLKIIRAKHPFVGYDMIRRNERAPILSMSMLLRTWAISERETPSTAPGTATSLATQLTAESVDQLNAFLSLAYKAWGPESQYARMWGMLNLVLTMWLYRRLVVTPYSPKTTRLTGDLFAKCLMALSADPAYGDWLVGRKLGERDRAPAYGRAKTIFQKRLKTETGKMYHMPAPPWTHGTKGGSR